MTDIQVLCWCSKNSKYTSNIKPISRDHAHHFPAYLSEARRIIRKHIQPIKFISYNLKLINDGLRFYKCRTLSFMDELPQKEMFPHSFGRAISKRRLLWMYAAMLSFQSKKKNTKISHTHKSFPSLSLLNQKVVSIFLPPSVPLSSLSPIMLMTKMVN